jgi:ferritin-like metal-binding protein YciE
MGRFTKHIKTMNDPFVHQLQDIYYAEQQLTEVLPKTAAKATDPQLKQGFLTQLTALAESKVNLRAAG